MAKMVLVCWRDPSQVNARWARQRLESFLDSLCPDHLAPATAVVNTDRQGAWLGVFNPADAKARRECNAYVGWLADPAAEWWRVGTPTPSGSHAMFRVSPDLIEVLADYAGSRVIWTAQSDRLFVASTSQRAISWFLGGFEPNPQAQAWMLSSGTLGPERGWDKRAQRLGPGGVLRLDRTHWRLTRHEPPIEFRVDPSPDDVHARRLRGALLETLGDLHLDTAQWVLPLSGGYDSRAILLMMRNRHGLQAVTWGSKGALERPGSDACVARRVAAKLGVAHRYHETDLTDEPVERLIGRYVVAGDGCTDGLWAYLDGFETWRHFYRSGVCGVIRGDHGFGPGPSFLPATQQDVHHFIGLLRWRDFPQVPALGAFGLVHLEEQPLPASFARARGESILDWRDRLYHSYRIPAYIAAQSDLKAAYVEIANPLLARELMALTRTYPTHLRQSKAAFRQAVAPYDIGVRYATEPALVTAREFLATPEVVEWLADQLASRRLRGAFTGEFADHLLESLRSEAGGQGLGWRKILRRRAAAMFPRRARPPWLIKPKRRGLDMRLVALRACIASIMLDRLSRDARSGAGRLDAYVERRRALPSAALTG